MEQLILCTCLDEILCSYLSSFPGLPLFHWSKTITKCQAAQFVAAQVGRDPTTDGKKHHTDREIEYKFLGVTLNRD